MTTETTDLLRGELERLFDVEELQKLASDLMGYGGEVSGDGKGALARSLVDQALRDDAMEALADAIRYHGKQSADLRRVFNMRGGREFETGELIGDFTVQKKLADGGLGVVYLGERGEGDACIRAAIKVIRSSLARDRSAAHRFLTAQRALKNTSVTGLGQVVDCGLLSDGRPWVATRFFEGQTLEARIQRVGPMHFNEASKVFKPVLEALVEIHREGLMHSDLKTGNIVVTRPEQADGTRGEPEGTLIDGGAYRLLAAGASHPDAIGALRVFGNAHAIAPEMARGEAVTAASDLYGVGVSLYETLTGSAPFDGESAFETISKHLTEAPKAPSEAAPKGWVSDELDAFVLKALAKDPADRFGSAQEMLDGLLALQKKRGKKEDLDEKAFKKAKKSLLKSPEKADFAAALEDIAAPARAWDKVIAAFEEACSQDGAKDETKVALLLRIARIQGIEKSERDAMIATYEKVRELEPANAIAQNGLEEACRNRGDWEGLAELLLERVDTASTTDERAAVLREIGRLYDERLGDQENALVAFTQALADEPTDHKTQRTVERLAGSNTDAWNEVLGTLNEVVAETEDPSEAASLYVLMGDWYSSRLHRPDFALPCYGEALSRDPSSDAAYDGATALYEKSESWQELSEFLVNRAGVTSNPAAARDYRAQAADVTLRKIGDEKSAIAMFEQVLGEDPAHPVALDALASLHEEKGEWDELAKMLKERAQISSGASKVSTHVKLGELYEDRLRDLEKAAVEYETALEQDPQSLPALKGLERVHAQTGDNQKLLEALQKQLEVVATPRQKVDLYEQVGALYDEELGNTAAAVMSFEAARAIDEKSESANAALARIYRTQGEFEKLVALLESHANVSSGSDRKSELYLRAARVALEDLGAPERSQELVEKAREASPQNTGALSFIAQLKATSGDAAAAVEAMNKLVEGAKDNDEKTKHLLSAARLLEDAGDNDSAIEQYKRVLDVKPDEAQASEALRRLYAARGDAGGAAEMLERELERTEKAEDKARLYAELGDLKKTRLSDSSGAKRAYESALGLDGKNLRASMGLGALAMEAGDAKRAAELYEPLASRLGELDSDQAKALGLAAGDALAAAGKTEKAQRAYLGTLRYGRKDPVLLRKLADATYDAGSTDEAAEYYGMLLQEATDLTGHDHKIVLLRRGDALREGGEYEDAEKLLNEALEIAPEADVVLALGRLYEAKGDHQKFVDFAAEHRPSLDDQGQFDLLIAVGDIQKDKLGDKEAAGKTFVSALEIKPDDRNLLTKLMGLYSETKDWSRLIEVILRIAELVREPKQLSKYYLTAGSIARCELSRFGEAADYYQQALEQDPDLDKALDGLIACYEAEDRHSELASLYESRAQSAGLTPESRAAFYDKVGALYVGDLSDPVKAAAAYERAQEFDGENRQRLETLLEIYDSEPKRFFRKSVSAHEQILHTSPYRVESYRALRELYAKRKLEDEEWCVCQTLKVLGVADSGEEATYKQHKSAHPTAAQDFFGEDIWFSHLVHPSLDPLLTDIFTTLTPAAMKVLMKDKSTYKVGDEDLVNPDGATEDMVRTLAYAAGVMKVGLPPLYKRSGDGGGLSTLFLEAPSIGLGKGALAGGPPQALAFVASRQLTYFRTGFFMRELVHSASGLRSWLLASIKFTNLAFPVPKKSVNAVETNLSAIQDGLSRSEQERLKSLVTKLLEAAPELDMKRWIAGVDLSADRVAFVMSNNLELASAVIKASPEGALSQEERLKELYLFSASASYMQLREKIGIAIE